MVRGSDACADSGGIALAGDDGVAPAGDEVGPAGDDVGPAGDEG